MEPPQSNPQYVRLLDQLLKLTIFTPLICFIGLMAFYMAFSCYAGHFNASCRRLVDENKLIGRPEADVIAVLGPPTYRYLVNPADGSQTMNYCPLGIPTAKFQVHFTHGVVTNVEQFDD